MNTFIRKNFIFGTDIYLFNSNIVTHYAPWWSSPWRGEGPYLTKRFRPVRQQGSSSEQRNYARAEQTDLFMLMPRTSFIRVASLSLVSFRHLSALARNWLMSYININISLPVHLSSRFLSSYRWPGTLSLEVKYDRIKNWDEGTWQKCLV